MKLWRISNYSDLSGAGGLRYSARWHTKGRPVIYAAEHPASALSEFLVHIDLEDMPNSFQLVTIELDDDIEAIKLEPDQLPKGWITDTRISRAVGDEWLKFGTSLLLRIPSVIIPDAYNILINPSHSDMNKLNVTKVERVPLDYRLGRS